LKAIKAISSPLP